MNAARKAHHLAPLKATVALGHVAAQWSAQLASADALSHNPALVSKVDHVMPNWRQIEENVGTMGAASAGSAADGRALAAAYLASPEHRANILSPTVHWIGIASSDGNGSLWNTVDFVG
jgi:uncharacterized protein YkwD